MLRTFLCFAFIVLLLPFSAFAIVPDPSVDLLLRLDETSGHTFFDASGNGHNATCSGSQCPAIGVRGAFGGGAQFDGSNDAIFVTVDVSETSYTSSLWFKTTTQNTGIFSVVDNFGAGGHDRHIYLSGGVLCARTYSDETICGGPSSLADGQWHHIAHVYGGTVGGQRIYVDGKLAITGSKAQSDFNWQTQVAVGFSLDSGNPYFKGTLDEVTVFHRALSAQEVKDLYEKGALRQNAAIDPAGKFVVYAGFAGNCVNQRPIFQPILSGKPSGTPKSLLSCTALPEDVMGFDLLRDGSSNQYWLAFQGSANTDPRMLMKIDSAGNIVQGPKAVLAASTFGYKVSGNALVDAGTNLRLFFAGPADLIEDALISKATLSAGNVKKTQITSFGVTNLQASQGPNRMFLAIQSPSLSLRGYGLDSSGVPDGTFWRISPRTDGGHRSGGVSADGTMALSADRFRSEKLYTQPLNSAGRPSADPRAMIIATGIGSTDCTGPVGSLRVLVYGSPTEFFLQKLDAITGDRLGNPTPLN
jgi:hypothetical protein